MATRIPILGKCIFWILICSSIGDMGFGKMLVNLIMLQQYPRLISDLYFMGDIVLGFVAGTAGMAILTQKIIKLLGELPNGQS